MSFIKRVGAATKAFINPSNNYHYDGGDYERPLLTVLDNFGYGDKKSLKQIVKAGFNNNTHIYSIIDRISTDASNIPVLIKAMNSAGDVEIITEGDFYDFVHNPNMEDTYRSITYKSMVYQLATGNEFQWGVEGIGSRHFSERYNLAPQYIVPKVINELTGPKATSYRYNYAGTDYPLAIEETMHLSKFNPDPGSQDAIMGLSPLQAAYKTMIGDSENSTAKASMIKNKGVFGVMSAKGGSNRPVTPEEGKQLDKALNNKLGGSHKQGKIASTSGAFDFIRLAMSPTDLQLIESGIWDLRDLCAVYGASSRKFGDPNGTTFNNVKEDNKQYYLNAVLPPLQLDLEHFHKFFVPGWNERDGVVYKVELDTSGIEALQEDQAKQMVKMRSEIEIIHKILTGLSNNTWDIESAKVQLMKAFKISEEEALEIIGNIPEPITTEPIIE